jgi:hypothetical protein
MPAILEGQQIAVSTSSAYQASLELYHMGFVMEVYFTVMGWNSCNCRCPYMRKLRANHLFVKPTYA